MANKTGVLVPFRSLESLSDCLGLTQLASGRAWTPNSNLWTVQLRVSRLEETVFLAQPEGTEPPFLLIPAVL